MMIKSGLAPLLAARMADITRSSAGEQWLPGRLKAGPMDNTAWHQLSSCELAGRMVDRTLRALPPRYPPAPRLSGAGSLSLHHHPHYSVARPDPAAVPSSPHRQQPHRPGSGNSSSEGVAPALAGMVPKAAERAEGAVELVVRPALREVLLEPVLDGVQSRRGRPAAEQLASRPPCFHGRAVRAVWLRRRGCP